VRAGRVAGTAASGVPAGDLARVFAADRCGLVLADSFPGDAGVLRGVPAAFVVFVFCFFVISAPSLSALADIRSAPGE
jgi:hypothetical protein